MDIAGPFAKTLRVIRIELAALPIALASTDVGVLLIGLLALQLRRLAGCFR